MWTIGRCLLYYPFGTYRHIALLIYLRNNYSLPRIVYPTDSTNFHETYILQIMGLNPPFGLKAILANKFIDKALTFKPKLIILIVPKETERCRNISWKLV